MDIQHPSLQPGQKQVIIIGAGFGGFNAARTLSHQKEVQVILIDQKNHHLFQPLLYQVATAGLNPSDIAVPIRAEFSDVENVAVHLGQVEELNISEKWIGDLRGNRLKFDYLILACGAQHSYFGKNEWEEFAPGLKTLEQATEIRRRILTAFELAENEIDSKRQEMLLTFVVVGGGPTGVELAGAIADISRTVLVKDFKRINPADAKIILLEAGPRIVPQFSESLSKKTIQDLARMGVEVRTSARVLKIDAEGVEVGGARIASQSVFWAAGVQAAKISQKLGVELDKAGRVIVNSDLSVPNHPDVFVVGDLAHLDLGGGHLLPGLAPAAIQTGKAAAKNILATLRGKSRSPFKYLDKGQMATIGKNKAIAQTGKLKLTGFIAWLAWFFVHILYLVGFKNRVAVFFQWIWCYIFSQRGSRLITQKNWKLETESPSGGKNPSLSQSAPVLDLKETAELRRS